MALATSVPHQCHICWQLFFSFFSQFEGVRFCFHDFQKGENPNNLQWTSSSKKASAVPNLGAQMTVPTPTMIGQCIAKVFLKKKPWPMCWNRTMVSMDKVLRHHLRVSRLVAKNGTFGSHMAANRVRIPTRAVLASTCHVMKENRIPLTLMVFVHAHPHWLCFHANDVTTVGSTGTLNAHSSEGGCWNQTMVSMDEVLYH